MHSATRQLTICTFATSLYLASPAFADLRVVFDEGAPKDRFTIENTGLCLLEDSRLTLDLATSTAGLIFDVSERGAGVEVFQPFQLIQGLQALAAVPTVRDGQAKVTFDILSLEPGASIEFTIDVDDTLGGREITVSDSEIEGALVSYETTAGVYSAQFSSSSEAEVTIADCTS